MICLRYHSLDHLVVDFGEVTQNLLKILVSSCIAKFDQADSFLVVEILQTHFTGLFKCRSTQMYALSSDGSLSSRRRTTTIEPLLCPKREISTFKWFS